MKIIVFGASGGVGREFINQASKKNHEVTGVYRHLLPSLPKNVRAIVHQNFNDLKKLSSEIHAADVIVSCLGLRRKTPQNPWSEVSSPSHLTEQFVKALIQGLDGQSKKVIVISAGGVGDSWPHVNIILQKLFSKSNIGVGYQDLNQMENLLSKSNLDWCAVRPTTLSFGRMTKNEKVIDRYGLFSHISRADVAHFMWQVAEGKKLETRVPMITG